MTSSKKKALLAASIAGLMTAAASAVAPAVFAAQAVPCYGINSCKGTGECGGKSSSCHGSNACKGQGWFKLPADTCTKIQGGRLTAE